LQIWISFQVLAFGLVATFQAFQYNYSTFLTTRILLGVAECGFIPGALYTLSTFYKRGELATVTAIFFLGNSLAGATSGLLAYGILPLGTTHPRYYGWQWLMLIEGSMACFVALLIICFLPGSPTRPRPLFLPMRYFSDREEQIIARRVVSDDAAKAATSRRLTAKEVFGTLGNWRIWPHVIMAIAYIAPTGAMGTYGPTIIRSFNFDSRSILAPTG
jgi:MFS family permease